MSQLILLSVLTCIIFLMSSAEAETKIWGSVDHADVYLRREAINIPAKSGASGEFEFVFPRKSEVNQFFISSIRAFDNDVENESSVTLINGGVDMLAATLSIKSAMDRGIDMVIEIYGKPL